ncbi:hypothetical protein MAR_003207, partial [Mya arenaria]
MMSSRPRLTFAVEGDKIVFTNTPNPTTDPSSVISYKCGLGEEITIGITQNVKMRFEWKDGKLVQHMHPTTMKKGTIEYSLNDKSQLLKVYKYSPENGGSDVTATIKRFEESCQLVHCHLERRETHRKTLLNQSHLGRYQALSGLCSFYTVKERDAIVDYSTYLGDIEEEQEE